MAENKKSFVLYADLIHTVKKMPKDKAGELFLTILSYVNDEQPVVDDMIVDLVFEPIKRQMKRDLVAYEAKKKQWSEAGKASAEAKKAAKEAEEKRSKEINEASTKVNDVENSSTDSTVTVNVNDTVNVTVNDTVTIKNLIKIKGEIFQKKPSEILQEEYRQMYEGLLMGKLKECDQILLLQRFDDEYPNYEFKDQNHFSNALKSTFDKLKKEKIPPKNFTNGKQQPESKFSQNAAVVNNILRGLDFKPNSD